MYATRLSGSGETYRVMPVTLARHPMPRRLGSLGVTQQTLQTAESLAATGASTTVGILVSMGVIGGPIGAAIGGLVAVGMLLANKIFKGCGQTCVMASNIANQVGDALTQNLNTYLASPVHYASLQAAALNNFDSAWAAMVQACGNPQLMKAGQNCITDRQQGACKWKSSPGGWQQKNGAWVYVAPGPAGSGSACWNYFVGMRDPIANDPTVVPDPPAAAVSGAISTAESAAASLLSTAGANPLLWAAAGLALAFMVL